MPAAYCRLTHRYAVTAGVRLVFDVHAEDDSYITMFVVDVPSLKEDNISFIIHRLTDGAPAWRDEKYPPRPQ